MTATPQPVEETPLWVKIINEELEKARKKGIKVNIPKDTTPPGELPNWVKFINDIVEEYERDPKAFHEKVVKERAEEEAKKKLAQVPPVNIEAPKPVVEEAFLEKEGNGFEGLYSMFLKRLGKLADSKGFVSLPDIYEKICPCFSLKKHEVREVMFLLAYTGHLKIVRYRGVKLRSGSW